MCALMQVVVKQPNVICSLSMEDTLKPRVDLLQHTIGLAEDVLPKVIARCATRPLHGHVRCWPWLPAEAGRAFPTTRACTCTPPGMAPYP